MDEDFRVQCLVFIVHGNDRLGDERSPTCTRKLRSSTARSRRCTAPRTLRNSLSAPVPLARAFVMLPEVCSRDRRSLLELFRQNDILVVNSENIARLLVGNDHLEVFEILLDDSPSASIDPLSLLTLKQYHNLVQLLFSNVKVRFNYEMRIPLIRPAVDKMNLKFIKRLLKPEEVSLQFGCNLSGSCKGTLLHMALFWNSIDVARKLIGYGADVHRLTSDGNSALHLATFHCPSMIQQLIDKGVSVDLVVPPWGFSPLYFAFTVAAAETLLQNGANVHGVRVEVDQIYQISPIMNAVEDGNIQLIKTLIHYGADVYCKDYLNRSILDHAYQSKKPGVLEFLLEFCFSGVHSLLEYPLKDFLTFLYKEFGQLHDPADGPDCLMVTIRHLFRMREIDQHVLSYQDITSSASESGCTKIPHEEFAKMSKQKVGGTDISFCDILTKSPNQIALLLRNEAFSDDVGSRDLETQFPVYGRILKYQLEKGMQRKNIQQEAAKIFTRLFSNFKSLPDEVQGMIFRHLSYQDFMILKRICTPHQT